MKPHSAKIMVDEHGTNYFAWSIITDGFFTLPYIKQFLDVSFKLEIMLMEGEHGIWASDINNIRNLAENTLKKLEAGSFKLKEIEKLHKFYGKKVLNESKKLLNSQALLKPLELAKQLQITWNDFAHLNCLGFLVVWSDLEHTLLTKKLEQILKSKRVNSEKIQEQLSFLISPSNPIEPWKEKKELLEIAKKYKTFKQAAQSKELQKHVQKYVWFQYGYKGPELMKEYFLNSLKKIYKSSPKIQYQEHLKYFKNLRLKQKHLEQSLLLTAKEMKYFSAARKIMYLKAYRVDVRHYFHWVMDKIFKKLSSQHKIPLTWFHYSERETILNLIRTGKADSKIGLNRFKFLLRITEDSKTYFINKNKASRFLKKALLKETISQTSQVTGNVAFPGKAKGVVRIVLSHKDIIKVQKGDILVATATNPDLLPAMSKAAAFITDAGGITSHAAIVAREMKKPCIIGTKHATKIFKDGDLVEVDANKGIVKKIN